MLRGARGYSNTWVLLVVSALLGLAASRGGARAELSEDAIQETFHPYRHGVPQVPQITPGLVITKDNWQIAKDVVPHEYLELIKRGWTEIKVSHRQ